MIPPTLFFFLQIVVAIQGPFGRDGTHNLGTCPDQEPNLQHFGYRMTLLPIELHQPGPVAFLYTSNELLGRKTKETIPFTIASKIIKYLGINLTKNVNKTCTQKIIRY